MGALHFIATGWDGSPIAELSNPWVTLGSLQLLKRLDIRPFDHDASLHEDLENAAVRYLELTLERGSGTWAQLGRNRHHSSPIAQRCEKMVGLQGGSDGT